MTTKEIERSIPDAREGSGRTDTTACEVAAVQRGHPRRLQSVDGLRAVAVLGVMWTHAWQASDFPRLPLSLGGMTLDINRCLAPLGNGVNLFFVISGFCMYLTCQARFDDFNARSYGAFVLRRWKRIAPAFYVCVLASAIAAPFRGRVVTAAIVVKHFFFAHLWPPSDNILNPPFWSLATEWHFYMVLPVLVWLWKRWPFWRVWSLAVISALLIRVMAYVTGMGLELGGGQIWLRLVEFMWGIAVAHLYVRRVAVPRQGLPPWAVLVLKQAKPRSAFLVVGKRV